MTTSPQDGPGPETAARNGRDQQMIDLRRTLNELDSLLGAEPGADNWGLAEAAAAPLQAPPAPAEKPAAPAAGAPAAGAPTVEAPTAGTVLVQAQDNRSLQLITRFAAGAVILGLEELVRLGEKWEAAAPPERLADQRADEKQEDTAGELLRYWLLGMVTSARRSGWRMALDALETPGRVVGVLGRTTDRAMGAWLFRPIRQPVSSAVNGVLSRMAARSESWITEGRREEQISRWIAANGVEEIIDGIINTVARSPEIDGIINTVAGSPEISAMVRDQLNRQSVGLVSTVADTGRRLTSVSDDMAENLVRRLLRRGPAPRAAPITPVEELPPSLIRRDEQVQ